MPTKTSLYFLIIILNLFYSCKPNKQKSNSIEGIWKSIGYGKILKIDTTTYKYYDITNVSCLPSKQGDIVSIQNSIKLINDTLTLKRGYSVDYYTKTKELPNICQQSRKNPNDILHNFEVFADTYKTHYAFFELNTINWDSLYSASKKKITPNTTEPELYLLFEEMLNTLNDNHGSVEPSEDVYEKAAQLNIQKEDTEEFKWYGDFEVGGLVAKHHLVENLTKDSWIVNWGKMENNIGYLQVNAMMLFADLKLSKNRIKENGFASAYFDAFEKLNYSEQIEMEVTGISKILDNVISDLWETQYMVIDVRFNGGGTDAVGLEILRRFNSKRQKIASKKARHKDGYTKITDLFLESSEKPYTKPVYFLTSQQSASATDMMALSSMELKQFKRIGSHTEGAISDALQKTLPNGWLFTLSNEIYTDTNGKCYENIGIPVHFELNYPDDRQTFFRSVANDLAKDKQNILKAIEELQKE